MRHSLINLITICGEGHAIWPTFCCYVTQCVIADHTLAIKLSHVTPECRERLAIGFAFGVVLGERNFGCVFVADVRPL
jgi:hypothetical protein